MDEHWRTVTLAADAARPHEEAIAWVAARAGTGIEHVRVVGVDPALEGRVGSDGKRVAEHVADETRDALPGVDVAIVRHAGPLDAALVRESDAGDLLVVGTFRSRRGSTAGNGPARVAERSAVPTVVVPDGPHPIDGDVVLAVEEPLDERAVAIAVDEARRRHRRLTVLRAWEMPVLTRTGLTDFAEDPLRWRRQNEALLQRATAVLAARYPDVRVRPLLVEGHPGRAIAAHTRQASLVVLGQGHVHVLSGSVLHDVLRATVSPVCVVPPSAHEAAASTAAADSATAGSATAGGAAATDAAPDDEEVPA
ncbi:universal stress protein family protein [Curtobacterium sp. PhB130]|uniref:universal stress protein n=1 Tax=Curtobacterium sp. PhB130 TaxID=2485178 RepID=UPI000F4CDA57|nr:universal stress protein [Curtobacterium sp. PhB130]ROS73816.1 universal stress protein family protein [Curtobacterium sp. PhB130]